MKKINFSLCIITIVFLFIGFSKTYDATIQPKTQEDNKYYHENFNKENLKQLVMVNDELYYNTERENAMPMKCGTMDGEITYMVNQDDIPNVNNQSNFGNGYVYQIGPQDEQILLNIDNKWMVFEKLQSNK